MQKILEAAMLVCFGFSWPMNLMKNWKARTARSMSLAFIVLVNVGYVAGICAKIVGNDVSYVLAVYFINFFMVFANMLVYFRNRRLDRAAGK